MLRFGQSISRTFSSSSILSKAELLLTLVLPNESIYTEKPVDKVSLPTVSAANPNNDQHQTSCQIITSESIKDMRNILQLSSGLIQIHRDDKVAKFFTAGGFAAASKNSLLNINLVSLYPLSAFNRSQVEELQLKSGDPLEKEILANLASCLY